MDLVTPNTSLPVLGKRKAENYECKERLAKRLSLLNLERERCQLNAAAGQIDLQCNRPTSQSLQLIAPIDIDTPTLTSNDVMQVEDSKHKIYIHDLDAEIREIESSEDSEMLFPYLKNRLLDYQIPPSVRPSATNDDNTQLVLYKVPGSLTIPHERDSVRRVILESRARAREKQNLNLSQSINIHPCSSNETQHSQISPGNHEPIDDQFYSCRDVDDVMELDVL